MQVVYLPLQCQKDSNTYGSMGERPKLIILADIGVCAGVKILRMRLDSARFHFLYGVGSLVGSAPGYGSGIRGLYLISINLS